MSRRSLALAVLQVDANADPSGALAACPEATQRYLVRPPGVEGPAPAGACVIAAPGADRIAAAGAVRALCPRDVVVVLESDERVSPDLDAALGELCGAARAGTYRARTLVRFLGREVQAAPVPIAWMGGADEDGSGPLLRGRVVKLARDIAGMITQLEARATSAASTRTVVRVGELAWRPAAALARRLRLRRRDGTPGLILSILETYGEILTAAKVWERLTEGGTRVRCRGLPAAFQRVETPEGWLIVRRDLRAELVRVLASIVPEDGVGETIGHDGRGATWRVTLRTDERTVIRWYRRGGAVRHLVRDRYFGWRPRPLKELLVTEEARRRGIAVPEVLGARVDRVRGGSYRGALATREITAARTLAALLAGRPPAHERDAAITAVARALRTLHDRGVHHRDLNAANILIAGSREAPCVYLIDFDRAVLRARVPARLRRRALRRLERSLAKLAATGVAVPENTAAAVCRTYWSAA